MMRSRLAFAIVAALAAGLSATALAQPAADPSPAAATPPAASAPNTATSAPCVTLAVRDISMREAFAYDLADVPTLRLLDALGALDPRAQRAVADGDPGTLPAKAVDAAIGATCTNEDVADADERVGYLIGKQWNAATFKQSGAAGHVSQFVATAIGAVRARAALPSATVAAALAPFGLAPETILSDALPVAPSPCPTGRTSARTTTTAHLSYPSRSRNARVTGIVLVRVALDEFGFIRSATFYRADKTGSTDENPDVAALVDEAVVAAAASRYAPELRDCTPRAGVFLFRAEFSGR